MKMKDEEYWINVFDSGELERKCSVKSFYSKGVRVRGMGEIWKQGENSLLE